VVIHSKEREFIRSVVFHCDKEALFTELSAPIQREDILKHIDWYTVSTKYYSCTLLERFGSY